MRILAVETSTLAGGAALLDGDRLVGEYVLNIRATHSERLMAAVDHLLHLSGWELGQLEGLAGGDRPRLLHRPPDRDQRGEGPRPGARASRRRRPDPRRPGRHTALRRSPRLPP